MFEKKKNGLLKLNQSGVRTPKVIFEKVRDSLAFLALKYIPTEALVIGNSWSKISYSSLK